MAKDWTEEEILEQINKTTERSVAAGNRKISSADSIDQSATVRHLLVIGCGDGGSMIASQIRAGIPGTFAICYNTSPRVLDKLNVDVKMTIDDTDGAGKVRQYSKDVFKNGSYKTLLGNVSAALNTHPDIAYIVVCATTDGGTGSGISPMAAKLISDSEDAGDIPVIILGVYPHINEDSTAQFNTMIWQEEVLKTGLPYMIFDNNAPGMANKLQIHDKVNRTIVNSLKVITGDIYGNSDISTIDSRDMWMLLENTGDRIVIVSDTTRPSMAQSLDAYVLTAMEKCLQPAPVNARATGVFLKGPEELIQKMDTSLADIRQQFGESVVQYTHIEESNDICISVIFSGCAEPADRLYEVKSRYDDIMSSQNQTVSTVSQLLSGMSNPVGEGKKKPKKTSIEPDLSALDL